MTIYCTGLNSSVGNLLNQDDELNLKPILTKTNRTSRNMIFENPSKLLKEDDYLIHIAWNMDKRDLESSYNINVDGARQLIDNLNNDQKKRFIFMSTINASDKSKSIYEQHKYEVENYVLEKGGYVIKCGLIYNSEDKFQFGFINSLYQMAKKFPLIPNFSGNSSIYYLTSDHELKNLILKIVNSNDLYLQKNNKCFSLGPISFETLVREVMALDKRIVKIPWIVGYVTSKLLEKLNINFPIKSDSMMAIK